jgi:hypothetical protein
MVHESLCTIQYDWGQEGSAERKASCIGGVGFKRSLKSAFIAYLSLDCLLCDGVQQMLIEEKT